MDLINEILINIVSWIESTITAIGPWGVAILMAIESCNIPLPSEAILPFAGYLVTTGAFSIHDAAIFGAIGCVIGSVPSYLLGSIGVRPFIEKYGKWFLISKKDLETADKWQKKWGDWAFFICRMLPVVRTFISLPAGILKANLPKFILFTFLGSLIWSYFLVWVGIKFGMHREAFKHIWHKFDVAIVLACIILFVLYLYHHFKNLKES
ncbi:DedA family protein [bacterium]|nr:DedA family protein [bacterium]